VSRIPAPPTSSGTELGRYLNTVGNFLNKLPDVSNFSLTTPNSVITAAPGTLGLNTNSAASVWWVKQVGSGNTGWISLA